MFALRKYAVVYLLIAVCVCTLMVDGKYEDRSAAVDVDEDKVTATNSDRNFNTRVIP